MAREVSTDNAASLLIGFFVVIFNRFAADRAIESQKKLTGIYPDAPVKAKRTGGLFFVAGGLFFIGTTVIQIVMRSPIRWPLEDAPGRILFGFGLLLVARGFIVDRRIAIDLTTEQACEILKANVPEKLVEWLVWLFVGIFVVFGATLIVTGVRGAISA
jgi:hypothetical protein